MIAPEFKCSVEGCTQDSRNYSGQYCENHRAMIQAGRSLVRPCKNCGEDFTYLSVKINGLDFCKDCKIKFDKFKQHKYSAYNHHITVFQYAELWEKQDGKCKLCDYKPEWNKRDKYSLSIDHDHACCPKGYSCGKCIRGLLCHSCNTMIGSYETGRGNLQIDVFDKYLAQEHVIFESRNYNND